MPLASKSARGAPPLHARLLVESQRGRINEPLALGVSLDGKVSGEMLMVAGFAEGTRLSAGAPLGRSGWQLSALDVGRAMAYAPPDFVGAMDARVDLAPPTTGCWTARWSGWSGLQKPEVLMAAVSPIAQPPAEAAAAQPLADDEIAGLLKRGQEFLRTGDIASARLCCGVPPTPAARRPHLALGGTFDGAVLAQLGVLGFARDADQARAWYRKAAELGSQEAEQRLEALGRSGK